MLATRWGLALVRASTPGELISRYLSRTKPRRRRKKEEPLGERQTYVTCWSRLASSERERERERREKREREERRERKRKRKRDRERERERESRVAPLFYEYELILRHQTIR